MFTDPAVWGGVSVFFSLVSGVIYLWATLWGPIRPHVFTWIIWSILTSIAFFIQYTEGAGAGSWATGASAFLCIVTVISCYWKGEKHITRFDWIVFVLGIGTIPLWIITKDPTMSIILVTLIDISAYFPTIRKSWWKPYEEATFTTHISNAKHIASLIAMEKLNLATVFYPAGLIAANAALVLVIYFRRYVCKPSEKADHNTVSIDPVP